MENLNLLEKAEEVFGKDLFKIINPIVNNDLKHVGWSVGMYDSNIEKMCIEDDAFHFWFLRQLTMAPLLTGYPGGQLYNEANIFHVWEGIIKAGVKIMAFVSLQNPDKIFIFTDNIKLAWKIECELALEKDKELKKNIL